MDEMIKDLKDASIGSVCKSCRVIFQKRYGNEKYCSLECGKRAVRERSRCGMRKVRYRKRGTSEKWYTCQVCGMVDITDLHHEGQDVYILCPNHHARITRGLMRIEDYHILPLER
jgi:hypothetical protein